MRAPRRHFAPALLAGLAWSLAAGGCDRTPLATGLPQETRDSCGLCHGSEESPAPPRALDGSEDSTQLAVGAHQVHLVASDSHAAVPCEACHRVPAEVADDGHLGEGPAEVVFSDFAQGEDLVPRWDRGSGRCDNVYCHGASLSGGLHISPVWNRVDGRQATCKGCHGNPPPPPHPQLSNCEQCHDETVAEDGSLDLAGGFHLDGELQARGECYDCHGSDPYPWPPIALDGSEDTTAVGVGAHDAHMTLGEFAFPVACDDCHLVPVELDDPGHFGSELPAEVTFAGVAVTGGASATWNHEAEPPTCSNVYCHGATLSGGTNTTPDWTAAGTDSVVCGSCHSLPPAAPHPDSTACQICHPGTTSDGVAIDVLGGLHVNGQVDVPTLCNGCHGDAESPAPPRDLSGNTATSARGVGAHRIHLDDSTRSRAIACNECHLVPLRTDSPGHLDEDLQAELVFGALASLGTNPSYDAASDAPSCSNVYCHGVTLSGGTLPQPGWTLSAASTGSCDSCHGSPPPAPHPQVDSCEACHPRTVIQDQVIDLSSDTHIDGEVTFY